jgi:hypothetical protein
VGAAAAGLLLASHLRLLTETPKTGRERLGTALMVQAGALLLATIAMATSGSGAILCWVSLAAASGIAARVLRAPALVAYAGVSLAIATVRLLAWDSWNGPLHTSPMVFAGLAITWWTGFVLLVASVWALLAWALRRLSMPLTAEELDDLTSSADAIVSSVRGPGSDNPHASTLRALAGLPGAVGVLVALASLLHNDATAMSISVAWALFCGIVMFLGSRHTSLGLRRGAMLGLIGSTLSWGGSLTMHTWSASPAPAFLHPGLLAALLISGVVAYAWSIVRRADLPDDAGKAFPIACGVWAGLLTLIATSLEAARVAFLFTGNERLEPVGATLAWGVVAIGLLVAGFAWQSMITRRTGLGLLAAAAVKAIIIDLDGVPLIGRVASFLVLGILMLAVAAVYARLEQNLAQHARTQ